MAGKIWMRAYLKVINDKLFTIQWIRLWAEADAGVERFLAFMIWIFLIKKN